MQSKIYIIEVKVDGEWTEFDGIEYAEISKDDMSSLRRLLGNLRQQNWEARRRCIDKRDLVILTCKPSTLNP